MRLIWVLMSLALFGCAAQSDMEIAQWDGIPQGTDFGSEQLQAGMDAARAGRYEEAVQILEPLAKEGDPIAQNSLGVIIYSGFLPDRNNKAEAAAWQRKAADQGYASAQYNLGVSYAEGNGVPQNHVEAQRLLKLAASQKSSYAAKNAVKYLDNWYKDPDKTNFLTQMYLHPECAYFIERPECAFTR